MFFRNLRPHALQVTARVRRTPNSFRSVQSRPTRHSIQNWALQTKWTSRRWYSDNTATHPTSTASATFNTPTEENRNSSSMIDVKAQRAVDNLNQLKTLIKSGDDVAALKVYVSTFASQPDKNHLAHAYMVGVYCRMGNFDIAEKLTQSITTSRGADWHSRTLAWGSLIVAYRNADNYTKAIETFNKMLEAKIHPSKQILTSMLRIFVDLQNHEKVREILAILRDRNFEIDAPIGNILLEHALRRNNMEEVTYIVQFMANRKLLSSADIWPHFVKPLLEADKLHPEQLPALGVSLQKAGLKIDIEFINIMLKHGQPDNRTPLFFTGVRFMQEQQLKPTNRTYTLLIRKYSQLGDNEAIEKLITEIRERFLTKDNFRPDSKLFAAAISHFTSVGEVDRVVQLVEDLKQANVIPDAHIYNELMGFYNACNRPDLSMQMFEEALRNKVTPSFGMLARAIFASSKDLLKVKELMTMAKRLGHESSPVFVRAVATVFIHHNLLEDAWQLLQTILKNGHIITDAQRDSIFKWMFSMLPERKEDAAQNAVLTFAERMENVLKAHSMTPPVRQFADATYDFIIIGRHASLQFTEDQYAACILAQEDAIKRAAEIMLLAMFDPSVELRLILERFFRYLASSSLIERENSLKWLKRVQTAPYLDSKLQDEVVAYLKRIIAEPEVPLSRAPLGVALT